MPAVWELKSIVSYDRADPAIDMDYFPNTNLMLYWSSSSYGYFASFVSFSDGINDGDYKFSVEHLRLVRGAQ